ncbi:uncharacterized protein BJ212DRAFT_1476314 [Suillus subaureus]|uniref:Zn(2)-C6 fungal-type domain-containing protein n=1 Tax=Suillus subaureus TaxID=48587 RepID=A0A9P7EJ29_9AGAM|nr:uncharacterized protein BJ212DRAFT_1476314 [Suillus subaureus]KAG1823427.1 hypothetical protein BJ212DRAFT_1476314 [Suillus subaureus]
MSLPPPTTTTRQTVLTGFTTPIDTTNVLKQLRATAALAVKKQQEAEEASRRAAEDLQRAEEEAKASRAKAKVEEDNQRRAVEKKLAEVDKKKTGTERVRRCTGCAKAKFDMPCTFSAASSSITTCDNCRRRKIACIFPGEAEKSKQKKRTVDEVESPHRGKGRKKSRHQSLSSSPIEIEEEVHEIAPVPAALQMLANKIGQLTDLVGHVNNAMAEGFAAHRKELHRMVTALDLLLEYREESATNESIKQE